MSRRKDLDEILGLIPTQREPTSEQLRQIRRKFSTEYSARELRILRQKLRSPIPVARAA